MKHLLDIESLDTDTIFTFIARAFEFKASKTYPHYPADLALLFYENSGRTRLSDELAYHRLNIHPVPINHVEIISHNIWVLHSLL